MTSSPTLARKLGTTDAVVIGLGSMMGAGIFAAFAPAAAAAGAGLLIGLAIAAGVAFCNATASAQLAAQYPTSGGTYVYGRKQLGEWSGFFAGWSFVIGKTASGAAMALVFAAYAAPAGWEKPVAVAAIVALAAVNYFGITRTAKLTRVIVVIVLIVLAIVVITGLTSIGSPQSSATANAPVFPVGLLDNGWYGILQSAGLLFFAFAGYARIATMGEEVRNPATTIPRAILMALGITLVVYALIAITALLTIGPTQLAGAVAPLVDIVNASNAAWAAPLVRIGAAAAALGALLGLVAGVGRTALAMARNRDLPTWLAAVHPVHKVPHHAEIALAIIMSVLVLTIDLRDAIGFSSFGVLLYYVIANVAAFTQTPEKRRYPKVLQVLGAISCLVLVATLPPLSSIVGLGVIVAGILYRVIRLRVQKTTG
ncbi:amino acid permease [Alpinimonas psychrophila]|uniref:APA family basic amino acid/polyamine antiporter n=1 Tax=Alpinimonas psychrophila TaxID=748908 RepID=A0A7W3JV85_9MICO|nr:APC family permease [Alpinimonas psychrophila]MBA8829853.1 APA family basic amino acid/polyamine antiporter [Alpinimonas psychrophila]